jgi:hypothetical protein
VRATIPGTRYAYGWGHLRVTLSLFDLTKAGFPCLFPWEAAYPEPPLGLECALALLVFLGFKVLRLLPWKPCRLLALPGNFPAW